MKKLLCALVVILVTLPSTLVFANKGDELDNIKIFSVQLTNYGDSSHPRLRELKVEELEEKIQKILHRYPHAKITILQSSGRFFTQITVMVRY